MEIGEDKKKKLNALYVFHKKQNLKNFLKFADCFILSQKSNFKYI